MPLIEMKGGKAKMIFLILIAFLFCIFGMNYYSPNFVPGHNFSSSPNYVAPSRRKSETEVTLELKDLDLKKLRELQRIYSGTLEGEKIYGVRKKRVLSLWNDRTGRQRKIKEEKRRKYLTNLVSDFESGRFDFSNFSFVEIADFVRIYENAVKELKGGKA